jgi:hypothetical protein
VEPVRAERGLLRAGTAQVPLLSGEVQFWRMDRADWERALDAVAAERIAIVSTYLSWRRHVPEPDAPFTWRHDERLDVHAFLALCAKRGLLVQLKPGPWICAEETNGGYPDWLLADRDVLALDSADQPVVGYNPPFLHPVPCYLHPRYLAHARRWIRLVHEHVGDWLHPHGPVALIQLDNEPSFCFRDGMYEADYHPIVLEEFARRHPGSVPPRVPEASVEPGSPRWRAEHNWIRFREWLLVEHIRRVRDAYVEAGATGVAFTVNYNRHAVDEVPQSQHAMRAAAGVLGGMDHYYEPPLDDDDLLAVARAAAFARAAREPIPWSPEIQAGIWRSPGEDVAYPDPTAAEQELYVAAALAFGLRGLNFYMLVDRENWEFAPLDPDGTPSPMLDAVRRAVAWLPALAGTQPVSPVALAWHSSYARDAYAAPDRARPHEATLAAFAELTRSGFFPRMWHTEDAVPDGVQAVVTAAGAYMPRGSQERLAELHAQGLQVIVLGHPPRTDEDGKCCEVLAGAEAALSIDRLAALLGARGIEAPVQVQEQGGIAILQRGAGRLLVVALNVRPDRRMLTLRFAGAGITGLRPLTDDAPTIRVADRAARIELGPSAGRLFEVLS